MTIYDYTFNSVLQFKVNGIGKYNFSVRIRFLFSTFINRKNKSNN